jgi:hypothetical protein
MEGSSKTISEESNINGGTMIFKNKLCRCGMKAGFRISESSQNPGELLFLFFFVKKGNANFLNGGSQMKWNLWEVCNLMKNTTEIQQKLDC